MSLNLLNGRRLLVLLGLISILFGIRHIFSLDDDDFETKIFEKSSTSNETVIISLASRGHRITRELPITLDSLLNQDSRPKEIRIYLPEEEKDWIQDLKFDWRFFDDIVNIRFVKDLGPSTKFIYVLKDLIDVAHMEGKRHLFEQEVLILDDDHSYSPSLISTLLTARNQYPDCALGMRGWRVREDLLWGVPLDEMSYHVIESPSIREPYRVSVLTANDGYLVKPRFFLSKEILENPTHFSKSFTLSHLSPLSMSIQGEPVVRYADDIFMAGVLSTIGTLRYVIPMPPKIIPNLDITVFKPLEEQIKENSLDRRDVNSRSLRFFEGQWRVEGLWYRFSNTPKGRREQPKWTGWRDRFDRWKRTQLRMRDLKKVWGEKVKFNS